MRARLAVESRATRAVDSSDASEARAVDGRRAIDRSIWLRLIVDREEGRDGARANARRASMEAKRVVFVSLKPSSSDADAGTSRGIAGSARSG